MYLKVDYSHAYCLLGLVPFLLRPLNRGLNARSLPARVAVVGSGNWGSVAARLVAANAARLGPAVEGEVRMWVHEETLDGGEPLTEYINRTGRNDKYLPDVDLGKNVRAVPDVIGAVEGASHVVFVAPHQFLGGILDTIVEGGGGPGGRLLAPDCRAVSLIKGMDVAPSGPRLLSSMIEERLGIECGVLMGANIASEVAQEQLSEATLGTRGDATSWLQLFQTPYFSVRATDDVETVELCGTLKNVVAVAAGLVDGLGMGANTKAALMRTGLLEMARFAELVAPKTARRDTMFESCGVADLIASCYGGRNRKVAAAYAAAGGQRSFEELEAELLGGQKLQGVLTAHEVTEALEAKGRRREFPLFSAVDRIARGELSPADITRYAELK